MKKLLLLLFTIVCLQAKTQYINLPDSNLRNQLLIRFPNCFNSLKQLDTSCAKTTTSITGYMGLYNNNINNLTGIEYFQNFTKFNFGLNPIRIFDKLSSNCTDLDLSSCSLDSLPLAITSSTALKKLTLTSNNIRNYSKLPSSIISLSIGKNNLSQLPILSNNVTTLNISNNPISNINNFSDSLRVLVCNNLMLNTLPNLPTKLTRLLCVANQLNSLPVLPNSLLELMCDSNKIISLPSLPNSIQLLSCSNNLLVNLPALPLNLSSLNCNNNQLSTLPSLPVKLSSVFCAYNKITSLPIQCQKLELLDCSNNLLTTIPNFVFPYTKIDSSTSNFRRIILNNNQLTTLPQFGHLNFNVCYRIFCDNNPISSIENTLNNTKIIEFSCSKTSIKTLPFLINLDNGNGSFTCRYNKIGRLSTFNCRNVDLSFSNFDTVPIKLGSITGALNLSFTKIESLSADYSSLYLVGNKKLKCIPKLPNKSPIFIHADSAVIRCLQDFPTSQQVFFYNTSAIDSLSYASWLNGTNNSLFQTSRSYLPTCNPTNNVNDCIVFPRIVGTVFNDLNNNLIKESNEPFKANVIIQLNSFNNTITNNNGEFYLEPHFLGNQTLTVTPPRFYTSVPSAVNLNFGRYDTLVNVPPIALQKTISKDSLTIRISPLQPAARPGFAYPFYVQYENVGSNTVNANINVTYNTTALNYDSSSTTVNAATAGTIQLLRNNFTPGSQGAFISYFTVKPSASLLGTNLKTWASISGGTALASDTTRRIIGGSYDPNDKLATPQLTTTQVADGEFINYTVRFQNTGTDTAFTVVIADTLNSLLQANSFEMIGSSHLCKTIIQDNKIYFEFRNILLPDSTTNLIGSNGFVNFRIKPISSVALNTSIPNKAAIYFDYNEPIITNTATTLISNTVLPLHLARFNVLYKQGSGVLFNWETKNEQAIKEFVVEESKDAINFKGLQQTASKGNGDNVYFSNANYAATEMVGSKFYRLKTINSNGNIAYSQVVKLNFDKSIQPFIILQNPVKGSLQIQVNAQGLNNTEALLINQEGKVVQTFKLQLGSQTLSLGRLVAGVYTLKTKEGSSLVVVR